MIHVRITAHAPLRLGLTETVIDSWAERLDVDEDLVRQLLQQQPGLLEATANSVKARLESLAALFEIPSGIAVQLIMKHPALAAVPPNATITRAKNLSSMLNMSMKSAAELMAKEPTILLLAAGDAGQLRPFAQPIYEVRGSIGCTRVVYVNKVIWCGLAGQCSCSDEEYR